MSDFSGDLSKPELIEGQTPPFEHHEVALTPEQVSKLQNDRYWLNVVIGNAVLPLLEDEPGSYHAVVEPDNGVNQFELNVYVSKGRDLAYSSVFLQKHVLPAISGGEDVIIKAKDWLDHGRGISDESDEVLVSRMIGEVITLIARASSIGIMTNVRSKSAVSPVKS